MSPARPTLSRAIVAALALYALLLQPFVAAATPVFGEAGMVCHTASDDPAPTAPGARHDCCLAACQAVATAAVPAPFSGLVPWPRRDALEVAWRAEGCVRARGPPTHAASARGPPLV